jgi:hypothetical protein
MIDLLAVQVALRGRVLGLSVCTTGSITMAATTTGYTRATGSFVTDGFKVGMEVTPAGFTSNPIDVITSVAALEIVTATPRAAQTAATGKTLTVGLPAMRAWENDKLTPVPGRPYLEEDFVPGTHRLITSPASQAHAEETGLYILKWYGLADRGTAALLKQADAIRALFTPGVTLTAGSNTLRMQPNTAVSVGQILPVTGGWAVIVITIPWLARSRNVVV